MLERVPFAILAPALLAAPLAAQIQFVDRSEELGVKRGAYGRGSAMIDLDGDGLLDIIGGNSGMQSDFYRQLPDHTFERANAQWGVPPVELWTWGTVATDFDNDGDAEVLFCNGSFVGPQPNQLLRNDLPEGGLMVDVSQSSGMAADPDDTFGGAALDYDGDGLLDVFFCEQRGPHTLMHNDGNLQFSDTSLSAGISGTGTFRHCSAGDVNNDGFPDIGAGCYSGANLVYVNDGDGTFTESAAAIGLDSPGYNFGLQFADFDNDGWLDAYVPKYYDPARTSEVYRNAGDGTFVNVTAGSGLTSQADMGHDVYDFDADGFPDILIGTGNPQFTVPDVLFRVVPNGAGGFVAQDVTSQSGILTNGLTRLHGMAVGDYDDDGDLDMFANNGGPSWLPGTFEISSFWENQGNDNAWLKLDLVGTKSNRFAIGARARVVAKNGREVHAMSSAGRGFANTPPPTLYFGLGTATDLDLIEIVWPSGTVQRVLEPQAYAHYTVTEAYLKKRNNPLIDDTWFLQVFGPAGSEAEIVPLRPFAGSGPGQVASSAGPEAPEAPEAPGAPGAPGGRRSRVVLDDAGRGQIVLDPSTLPEGTIAVQARIVPKDGGPVSVTEALAL